MSTYCRSCGSYYKIENGKPVANTPAALRSFEGSAESNGNSPTATLRKGEAAEARDEQRRYPTAEAPTIHTPDEEVPSREDVLQRMAHAGPNGQHDIECLECGHVHSIPNDAASALCPRCGEYVSLKNYDIRDTWDRRIRTRGDVFVHRSGRVEDVPVYCHHLTVEGEFSGSVDCTGDFIIRRHGKIMGRVRCRRLIIESKGVVEFANNVHADEVYIDGSVQGDIRCAGKLVLEKNATLKGDLHVHSLIISDGARHSGQVAVGAPVV